VKGENNNHSVEEGKKLDLPAVVTVEHLALWDYQRGQEYKLIVSSLLEKLPSFLEAVEAPLRQERRRCLCITYRTAMTNSLCLRPGKPSLQFESAES